jgi:outer membrane protein OmpA-like peptidoglycan-associated protein
MSRASTAVAALGGALAIVIGLAFAQASRIENDLDATSRAALVAHGLSGVDIRFDGRDATLSGPGVSDIAIALVAAQPGVHSVTVDRATQRTSTVLEPPVTTPGRGTEELPASQVAQGIVNLLGEDGLRFDPGSAALADRYRTVVEQIAGLLVGHPAIRMQIAGHSDGTAADGGSAPALSTRRASAVADILAANGVGRRGMTVIGVGNTQPAGDSATAAGRALNRRVDITILGG